MDGMRHNPPVCDAPYGVSRGSGMCEVFTDFSVVILVCSDDQYEVAYRRILVHLPILESDVRRPLISPLLQEAAIDHYTSHNDTTMHKTMERVSKGMVEC